MVDVITSTQQTPFQMRGSLFTLSVMQLQNANLAEISRELKAVIRQAPKFFNGAPVVIDCEHVSDAIDFPGLSQVLREQGLIPVGIRNGISEQHEAARNANLAVLSSVKTEEPTLATRQKKSSQQSQTPALRPATHNVMVTKPVRSGQQVYAKQGDLVVIGQVSHGAELLADGNIHVYGALRGRALAGINGNTEARIFCQRMEAELVSIAGRYIVSESLKNHTVDQAQQIFLQDGKLAFAPL